MCISPLTFAQHIAPQLAACPVSNGGTIVRCSKLHRCTCSGVVGPGLAPLAQINAVLA
jgi:hypothetical protein